MGLDDLRTLARGAAAHSRARYSSEPRGSIALLSDGAWVPGIRLESASLSLVVPASTAAIAAAVAAGRRDIVAVALSDAARPEDIAFLAEAPTGPLRSVHSSIFARDDVLPVVGPMLPLATPLPTGFTPAHGVALAAATARRSLVPYSSFPVGCVLQTSSGNLIAGTNVEHRDWTRTICAERSALVAALSLGLSDITAIFVACLEDPDASPCGACRQLLAEWAPEATVWMHRGAGSPDAHSTAQLLPSCFSGRTLRRPKH